VIENRLFEVALGSPSIPPIKRRLKAEDFLSLNSVADEAKPFAASLLSHISNRPILLVTDGLKSQEAFFNDLQTLLPGVQFYPAWETLPHEDALPNASTIADRLKVLTNLNAPVTVASVQALTQRTFAPEYFMSLRSEIQLGQTLELQEFLNTLTELGYRAEYQVSDPATWRCEAGLSISSPSTAMSLSASSFPVTRLSRFARSIPSRSSRAKNGNDSSSLLLVNSAF